MARRLWKNVPHHKKRGVIDFLSSVTGVSPGEAELMIESKGEVFDENSMPSGVWDDYNDERIKGISGPGTATSVISDFMKDFYRYKPQAAVDLAAGASMERLNARVAAKEKAKASSPAPIKTVNIKDIPADLPLDPQMQASVDQEIQAQSLLNERIKELDTSKEDFNNLLLYGGGALALGGGGVAIGKSTEPSEDEIIAAYLARQS
tara:strand:- start:127 stop:744 length:618 start_codon:yes stop_codon:yes gene_type:complete